MEKKSNTLCLLAPVKINLGWYRTGTNLSENLIAPASERRSNYLKMKPLLKITVHHLTKNHRKNTSLRRSRKSYFYNKILRFRILWCSFNLFWSHMNSNYHTRKLVSYLLLPVSCWFGICNTSLQHLVVHITYQWN